MKHELKQVSLTWQQTALCCSQQLRLQNALCRRTAVRQFRRLLSVDLLFLFQRDDDDDHTVSRDRLNALTRFSVPLRTVDHGTARHRNGAGAVCLLFSCCERVRLIFRAAALLFCSHAHSF